MPLRIAVLTFWLLLGLSSAAEPDSKTSNNVLTTCAAFGTDGSWTSVTVDAVDIILELTSPDGMASRLSLPLRYPPADKDSRATQIFSCKAFFNAGSNLIAVGVSDGFPMRRLQVAVADAKQSKWTGEWGTEPASGFYEPFLAGFLESTSSIVVAGEPSTKDGNGMQHGLLWTLLFDSLGHQLSSATNERIYSHKDFSLFFTDANHNRLWFFPCIVVSGKYTRQPDCPIAWTTLIGEAISSGEFDPLNPGQKRTDFWMVPGTLASPNHNTAFIAETVVGVNMAWLVNVQKQTVDRLILPKRLHFPNFEEIHGPAALSPDGEVAAFPLVKEALAFPYLMDNYDYKGQDVAVVLLHPFQLLRILPGGAFAIDHRNGKVRVLVFRQGHWELQEFADTHA